MIPPALQGSSETMPATSVGDVAVRQPGFADVRTTADGAALASLQNVLDVKVTLAAELGRAALDIAQILKLTAGSVVELDRSVFDLVELVVQGVCIGRGEVVVVNDHFAVRLKEITDPRARSSGPAAPNG